MEAKGRRQLRGTQAEEEEQEEEERLRTGESPVRCGQVIHPEEEKGDEGEEEERERVERVRADLCSLRGSLSALRTEAQFAQAALMEEVQAAVLRREREHAEREAELQKALEEETERRRALLHEVQGLKGNVRVLCRIRGGGDDSSPAVTDTTRTVVTVDYEGVLQAKQQQQQQQQPQKQTRQATKAAQQQQQQQQQQAPQGRTRSRKPVGGSSAAASRKKAGVDPLSLKAFEFDHVFGTTASQASVFAELRGLVVAAVDGFHATILAYGQTGSGKTYTMIGTEENPGVTTQALQLLFRLKQEREVAQQTRVDVTVSMVEVYNEEAYDLLGSGGGNAATKGGNRTSASVVDIRKRGNSVVLDGASVREVTEWADVHNIMAQGNRARSVTSTRMNERSSRSHAIVIVNVVTTNLENNTTRSGRLTLVDLAGSERVAKSQASGAALVEAQNINRSLSVLGQVFAALRQRQGQGQRSSSSSSGANTLHVPFRDSKLTFLLMDSFAPGQKAVLIVQVAPETTHISESVCSLQFAERARGVALGKSTPQMTKAMATEEAKRLRQQIVTVQNQLKEQELAHHATESQLVRLQEEVLPATQGSLEAATQQRDELRRQLVDAEARFAERDEACTHLTTLNSTFSATSDRLKAQVADLRTRLAAAEAHAATVEELQRQQSDDAATILQLQQERNALKEQLAQHASKRRRVQLSSSATASPPQTQHPRPAVRERNRRVAFQDPRPGLSSPILGSAPSAATAAAEAMAADDDAAEKLALVGAVDQEQDEEDDFGTLGPANSTSDWGHTSEGSFVGGQGVVVAGGCLKATSTRFQSQQQQRSVTATGAVRSISNTSIITTSSSTARVVATTTSRQPLGARATSDYNRRTTRGGTGSKRKVMTAGSGEPASWSSSLRGSSGATTARSVGRARMGLPSRVQQQQCAEDDAPPTFARRSQSQPRMRSRWPR